MTPDWQSAAVSLAQLLFAEKHAAARFAAMFPQDDSPIAVACSGGPDSLAALLCTWALLPEKRATLCVLHYDHAVRATSAADAAFVRDVCAGLQTDYVSERRDESVERPIVPANFLARLLPLPKHALSEGDLRDLRLDFFARAMKARGIRTLVQGHQRDDIAETLLMRLTRGSGTEGLAAPRPISRRRDGRLFVRPLLDFPKARILEALRACKIPWCEDHSNAGTDYFRNRIRNRVLPSLLDAAPFENFARSRRLLEEAADFIDAEAEKVLNGDYTPQAAAKLAGLPPALVRAALQKILTAQKCLPAAKNLDALVSAVVEKKPQTFSHASRRQICWNGAQLELLEPSVPEDKISEPEPAWEFSAEPVRVDEALFEAIRSGAFPPDETVFLAGNPTIFARAARPDDRYRPLGAPGEKRLSRIFIDKKIPQKMRQSLPVFDDGTGIAWIPGLPPAERFRIREAGSSALRLTYRKASLR